MKARGGHILLVGPRACGKSSAGALLAKRLGIPFFDADELLQERLGTSISEFVAERGWERFRDEESRLLESYLLQKRPGSDAPFASVLATGGGVVLLERNRELLRRGGFCVYLKAPADVLAGRLQRDPKAAMRPSLTGEDIAKEARAILEEREALYLRVADAVADATRPKEEICRFIEEAAARPWPSPDFPF